jgi:hypothetical protein
MGMGGQRHVPAALPPGKTQYPSYRRLAGWTGAEIPPPGIRSPDRPARSESLYRLRYPGHLSTYTSSFRKQYHSDYFFTKTWDAFLVSSRVLHFCIALEVCLHRDFYGGSCTRVLRDGAVHSARGKRCVTYGR